MDVKTSSDGAVSDGNLIGAAVGQLKSFGALVTAIVTLASTLFACSEDNIKRNDAFVSAVASQEKQWQSLYDQYFAALAAKDDAGDVREKRLLSICQFSNRLIPDFKEHRLGYFWILDKEKRQQEAQEQLSKLKLSLRTALATDGIGTEKSAECVLNQKREQDEDKRNVRTRVVDVRATTAPESVSISDQNETINRVIKSKAIVRKAASTEVAAPQSTLTLAVGDPRGYDIDVFWCVGPGDEGRQAGAAKVAALLTQNARSRQKIGNLFRIGRVRLRPLTVERQIGGGYPTSGFEVRGDPYERDVAELLTGFLNEGSAVGPFVSFESGLDTKWYLSAFVCS